MGHVAIFRNDLESLDRLCVADDIVEKNGSVFFDPKKRNSRTSVQALEMSRINAYQGSSYVTEPVALEVWAFAAAVEDSPRVSAFEGGILESDEKVFLESRQRVSQSARLPKKILLKIGVKRRGRSFMRVLSRRGGVASRFPIGLKWFSRLHMWAPVLAITLTLVTRGNHNTV